VSALLAAGYPGLFAVALIAATLFPAQSELLLAAMAVSGRYDPAMLLAVATAGNVLGSIINWAIGRFLEAQRGARWFPVSEKALEKAERVYARWGSWTLLLSWLPLIGDPLTLVAGMLRTPFARFVLLVTVAKAGRYLVVLATAAQFA
jgi:membrane protein YqaA with SNARE-associated domain